MLKPADYQNAIDAQSACNLSGVAHALSKIVPRIWDEPDCTGTDYMNRHPITVLYASQIIYLAGGGLPSDMDAYDAAYKACAYGAEGAVIHHTAA